MSQVSGHLEQATSRRPATVVGAGVLIRGDIEGVTDLHVHGQVIGKVAVADLVVDGDALIDGPVKAEIAVISGRVIGPVDAKTVRLSASARVDGDVTCDSIHIEAGARFTGRCVSDEPSERKVLPFAREPMLPSARNADDEAIPASVGEELLMMVARLRRLSE